jgi:hypothetical protein
VNHHCGRPDDGSRVWRSDDGLHIDVRGLPPPEPAVAILQLLDSGEVEGALIAHLDREPVFLFPELDDRGWDYDVLAPEGHSCDEDEVRVRMMRWRK